MYSIKRFNKIEQKEYVNPGRLYKVGIGRTRRTLGELFEKGIKWNLNKANKYKSSMRSGIRYSGKVSDQLSTEEAKRSAAIIDLGPRANSQLAKSSQVSESMIKDMTDRARSGMSKNVESRVSDLSNNIRNATKEKDNLIVGNFGPKSVNMEDIAHEMGHIDVDKSKGISGLASRVAGDHKNKSLFNTNVSSDKGTGFGFRQAGVGLATVKNESDATKVGFNIIDSLDASRIEVENAKENLRNAKKAYRSTAIANILYPPRNFFQIPSRRGLNYGDKGFGKLKGGTNLK